MLKELTELRNVNPSGKMIVAVMDSDANFFIMSSLPRKTKITFK